MTGWPLALVTIGGGAVLGFVIAAVSSAPAIANYRTRIDNLRVTLRLIADAPEADEGSRAEARAALRIDDREAERGA